ncbi:MAG: BrnT family toxin [Caldilineaceae bacterium]|nr:BrnT family toxin [Caldilineaceae bacterium]
MQVDRGTGIQYANGETRSVAVGQIAGGGIITVVYTMRGRVRRIISARKARRNEQRAYVENQSSG